MSDQISGDIEAERTLLSACLHSKVALREAKKHIVGADFLDPRHEDIWNHMCHLEYHGRDIDAMIVSRAVPSASASMVEIVAAFGIPDNVATYAAIIRAWSIRRKIESAARATLQQALNPEVNPGTFAAEVATRFAAIRDSGQDESDFTAITVSELLGQEDDEPEWLVPGLLERRDRFVLTGEEGLGKSHMLRQFAILCAAGLDPFAGTPMPPVRSVIIDCENTWAQVRRKIRPTVEWTRGRAEDPSDRIMVDCTARMDITRDKDLARIHQILDAAQPDVVVIGPLYRLVPRALQTDDDTAPVLAALDTIRDRGCALLMEAHAGHAIGKGGQRDLRPRGSSSLLGWPEFGYGLRYVAEGYADLVQWRGPREERAWPQRVRRGDGHRWVPHVNLYGYEETA